MTEGIEFETDQSLADTRSFDNTPKTSAMMRLIMRLGIRNATTANYVFIGIAGIGLGLTIFLYANSLMEPKRDLAAEKRFLLITK